MRIKYIDMKAHMGGLVKITAVVDGDRQQIAELVDEASEKPYELKIEKVKKKRSLDANAYAWVLIDKIADKLKINKSDVYRSVIRDIPGVSTTVCVKNEAMSELVERWACNGLGWQADILPSRIAGCSDVILYCGSSVYSTEQMARLIDSLIEEAKDLGIETLTPQQLNLLKGYKGD